MFACNHPDTGERERDVRKLFIDNIKELGKYAQNIGQTIILEPVTPYEGTIWSPAMTWPGPWKK